MPGQGQIHAAKTGAAFSWTARYLTHSAEERSSLFYKIFPSYRRRSAKLGKCFSAFQFRRVLAA